MVSIPFQAVFAADEPVTSGQTEVSTGETVQTAEQEVESKSWTPTEDETKAQNTEGDLSLAELKDKVLPAEDTPEVIDTATIAEKGHVNRLKAQETDLNTVIFQNKDGTKTMYYFAEPVKYKDENNIIHDKHNSVTDLIDKPSYTEDYGFVNGNNDIKTYFPKTLSNNKGVLLEKDDIKIEIIPVSGKGIALPDKTNLSIGIETDLADLQQPLELEANPALAARQPIAIGLGRETDTVNYSSVFGPHTEIRYKPQFNGFKEDIILNEYTGVNTFTFRVKTNGLSLAADEYGVYNFINPLTGEIRAQLGSLLVYDSKPFDVPDKILNESVSNPTEEDFANLDQTIADSVKSLPVGNTTDESLADELQADKGDILPVSNKYVVSILATDEEYLITIVVDESYLTDPERVWPVYVDPTISVTGSGSNKTIQDASIYSNRPSTAYGGDYDALVGYYGGGFLGAGRTLMKFPGLASNSVYASLSTNQITSLDLHAYENSNSSTLAHIFLWQYTGASWTELTAKCSNIGWNSYTNFIAWNQINCSGWQTFDLESMVATWKSSPTALDKGIMMTNYTSESSPLYLKEFLTTESNTKPYLMFDYSPAQASGISGGDVYTIRNISTLRYIDANNASSLDQSARNTNDGGQLWYLTWLGNGYYQLTSLGLREPSTQGASDYVMSVNSSSQIVLTKDIDASNQQWAINRSGSSYYFVNRSFPEVVMTVDSSTGNPYLANKTACSGWTMSPVTTNIFSTTCTETEYGGYNGVRPIRINFIVADSAITAELPFTMYQDAANRWNGVSGNIIVNGAYRVNQTPPTGVTVNIEGNNSVSGLGSTGPITGGGVMTEIRIGINIVNLGSLTAETDRRKTIIHEMGHALRLGDINLATSPPEVVAIMNQNPPSQNLLVSVIPSGYDQSTLRTRWS